MKYHQKKEKYNEKISKLENEISSKETIVEEYSSKLKKL